MMIKKLMRMLVVSFLLSPLVASADNKPDPLQYYRNQIKRAETNAAQTSLDQMEPDKSDAAATTRRAQATPAAPTPQPAGSNADKAFSAPAIPQQGTPTNKSSDPNTTNNPWLKPNPWEAKSQVNPWANAPIPGPGGVTNTPNPTGSAPATPPSEPPNIFAPPHSTANVPNSTNPAAKKTYS